MNARFADLLGDQRRIRRPGVVRLGQRSQDDVNRPRRASRQRGQDEADLVHGAEPVRADDERGGPQADNQVAGVENFAQGTQ